MFDANVAQEMFRQIAELRAQMWWIQGQQVAALGAVVAFFAVRVIRNGNGRRK